MTAPQPPKAPQTLPADFAELVKACTLAAIRRTARRNTAAAEHARNNLEDITQAAALEALERITRGDAAGMDPAQLCSRAAAAVLMGAYRDAARRQAHETPDAIPTADGEDIHPAELETRRGPAERPTEDASTAAGILQSIIEAIPAAYQADAPSILKAAADGWTAAEIARRTGAQPRRVQRIIKAAREAAAREEATT